MNGTFMGKCLKGEVEARIIICHVFDDFTESQSIGLDKDILETVKKLYKYV